ncbi:ABC transporter ATP-binding protein [Roseicyclus persicicus]|uniref:ABC transporter ATP-binding protein n=1 Tax=Roseicyclus persicicus TaxID=2650661 RepID=A0A7X6GWQ6_9RHOB|nr:ABC transporter ATP-binding protein [Roseibacterium persicicum]NKX42968.1 ABC transporter ATP-binding protein [Roseibacterium persicicum]
MASSPYMIELREVTHAYRTKAGPLPVLDSLSIKIPENSFAAVVGPSGCGKSTLTRLVSGLMKPNEGQVWLHSQLVTSPRPTVGMAFQNPVLLEWRTILQNVLLPMEIVRSPMSRAEAEARARHLLELVGLKGFEDKRPSELSGGMRQRASLCRSIIHKPDVLILDEPFGALDAFTREDLWCTMHDLREEEPFTCLLITHDLRESVFLADQVIVLSGRPAHAQYVLEVDLPGKRSLDDLYSPRAVEMLAILRHQIQVAQGRATDADAPLDGHPAAEAHA